MTIRSLTFAPGGVPVIGQTVNLGMVVQGPWTRRRGDRARFFCQAITSTAEASLTVDIEHRNEADTTAGSFSPVTVEGITSLQLEGLKQLWRYKLTGGTEGKSGTLWTHVRILDPVWIPN